MIARSTQLLYDDNILASIHTHILNNPNQQHIPAAALAAVVKTEQIVL